MCKCALSTTDAIPDAIQRGTQVTKVTPTYIIFLSRESMDMFQYIAHWLVY